MKKNLYGANTTPPNDMTLDINTINNLYDNEIDDNLKDNILYKLPKSILEKRSNLWTFIVWDDSAPSNWLSIIDSWHIPALISPHHDKDINPNNTLKKPHYHVILHFGSGANKSINQVYDLIKLLNTSLPYIVKTAVGLIRYFVHIDNPEKHPYNINDFKSFCGFEYLFAFDSQSDDNIRYAKIEDIIYNNSIYNYALLINYLKNEKETELLIFIRKHSYHIKCILDGYYQLLTNRKIQKLNLNELLKEKKEIE